MFDSIQGEHKRQKSSSLTLPLVKKEDDTSTKENVKPSSVEKLPDINNKSSSDAEYVDNNKRNGSNGESNNSKEKRRKKRSKTVKRLSNGERLTRIVPTVEQNYDELANLMDKKTTPEEAILRVTGGVELVPLLARRRRVGARTLPSSDVTRPQDQDCQ